MCTDKKHMDPFIVKKKSKNKKSDRRVASSQPHRKNIVEKKKEKHLKQILHLTLRDDRLHEQDYQTATKRVNSP